MLSLLYIITSNLKHIILRKPLLFILYKQDTAEIQTLFSYVKAHGLTSTVWVNHVHSEVDKRRPENNFLEFLSVNFLYFFWTNWIESLNGPNEKSSHERWDESHLLRSAAFRFGSLMEW